MHILASPGYAPGTIAVNVTWIKRGFNACQTHRSMYPSIFNRFSNSTRKFKSSPFRTFFAHFGLPWVRPWDNRCKCYMDGKRIQCCMVKRIATYTHLSSTVYEPDIDRKLQLLPIPLAFNAPVGGDPLDDLRDFWWMSCRMARLQYDAKISPKS